MASIIIITQKVDENDDLLGSFIGWLGEFAKYFDRVRVITLAQGKHHLPANVSVHSLGKEVGRSKLFQFFKLYYLLIKYVPTSAGVFAHMSPIFAIAAAPVAGIFGKKLILWYLHRNLTFKLKLASLLSDNVVTASKESLDLRNNRILELGHGIDVDFFRAPRSWVGESAKPFNILSVGRISPIKDYETLIQAAGVLKKQGLDFKIRIVGRPVMKNDFGYFESLKQLVSKQNLADKIEFSGRLPYRKMPEIYKDADLVVNLAPKGGIDKAVLEAMAAGALVLTSNWAFRRYFRQYAYRLVFEHKNQRDLVEKITALNALSPAEKHQISDFLVAAVAKAHSLEILINNITRLYKGIV